MRFSKFLYIGKGIKHPGIVKFRLKRGIGLSGHYVVCINTGLDQLDIYPALVLKNRIYRKIPLAVVAIVKDTFQAEDYLIDILNEAHAATGRYSIKDYMLEREPELKRYLDI